VDEIASRTITFLRRIHFGAFQKGRLACETRNPRGTPHFCRLLSGLVQIDLRTDEATKIDLTGLGRRRNCRLCPVD